MKRIQIKCLALCCGFFALTVLSNSALALNSGIRLKMTWTADFDDSDLGEDIMDDSSATAYANAYGYYRISLASTDETLFEGYLDSSGYSTYHTLTDGVQYKIRQSTKAVRGTKEAYWHTDSTSPYDWNHAKVNYVRYYTPSGHSQGQQSTYVVPSVGVNFNSNIGAVLQRYMRYTTTLNVPSNTHLHILGYSTTGDEGSDIHAEDDHVSGHGSDQRVHIHWSTGLGHANRKFLVAHEIGHAVGHFGTSRIGSGNYEIRDTTHSAHANYCYSGEGTDPDDANHWYNSKEYIRAAEQEGFGHFIATQFFNTRDSEEMAYFGSYRTIPWPSPYPTGISNPTYTSTTASWGSNLNLSSPRLWMEQICDVTTSANMGVEWDWAAFFWHLFANGDDRLDILDIKNIWPNDGAATSTMNWTNLLPAFPSITTAAEGYLSGDEEDNFFQVAIDCGIDHGYDG